MRQSSLTLMEVQAAQLADDDARDLESARQRVRAVELELTKACEALTVIEKKACCSSELLAAIRERREKRTDGGPFGGLPADETAEAAEDVPRVSIAEAIRSFLHGQEEVTISQVTEHVARVRPDVNSSSIGQELSRMARRGELVRPHNGSYRLSAQEVTASS